MAEGVGIEPTEDKIIAIARKSPSVSIPQMAEILGISTRAVEKQRVLPSLERKMASLR